MEKVMSQNVLKALKSSITSETIWPTMHLDAYYSSYQHYSLLSSTVKNISWPNRAYAYRFPVECYTLQLHTPLGLWQLLLDMILYSVQSRDSCRNPCL